MEVELSTTPPADHLSQNNEHPIAVILPVYRDTAMTLRCIESALGDILGRADRRLIVINDASPEPDMAAALEAVAQRWPNHVELHHNADNLGFVLTVNRGFRLAGEADVVLLNSDVIVAGDWLGRLQRVACGDSAIGTVTPLSNNAEICSFPRFIQDNPPFLDLETRQIDEAFGRCRLPPVEAPTGVGFCMYIKAACLRDTGPLDHEQFGRGYGEENDFCQRALARGWKSVISADLFAYHEGGVSFSGEKAERIANAMRTIDRLHPNYHADVQRFISADLLKPQRIVKALDVLAGLSAPKVLLIDHGLGGGVGQHVDELIAALQGVVHFLRLRPGDHGNSVILDIAAGCDRITLDLSAERELLIELLLRAGTGLVHYHHTVGFGDDILDLPQAAGLPHIVTVHDFYWLNGNPTLSDEQGVHRPERMDAVNPLYPPPPGYDTERWRQALRPLLEQAAAVIFPSQSTLALYRNFYQLDNASVVRHLEPGRPEQPCRLAGRGNPVRIAALGAISKAKGADLLEAIASQGGAMAKRFSLIGYSYRPLDNVHATGPYQAEELPALIERHRPDVWLFTAQWPETYCYTLSYALASGEPIIAPRIGAFIERLEGREGVLLFDYLDPPARIAEQIDDFLARPGAKESGAQAATEVATTAQQRQCSEQFYRERYPGFAAASPLPLPDGARLHDALLQHRDPAPGQIATSWRERLLRQLWRAYNWHWLKPVSNLLPFAMRRGVKRLLSRRPLHDIVRPRS